MLAFVPLDGMVQQLVLTFVFGLAMACFALRVNSLVPLIVFHALWDMVQFLGGIYGADFGQLILVGDRGQRGGGRRRCGGWWCGSGRGPNKYLTFDLISEAFPEEFRLSVYPSPSAYPHGVVKMIARKIESAD